MEKAQRGEGPESDSLPSKCGKYAGREGQGCRHQKREAALRVPRTSGSLFGPATICTETFNRSFSANWDRDTQGLESKSQPK